LTFAEAVEQIRVGDRGRSRVPIDDRDNFAAERLHPKVKKWRFRPRPCENAARHLFERTTCL
jgi:hypothetical protein